ncbi:short chain dehydrogenase/reductase family oxidoreductase [Legionella busanensis]|uniref:Short chain dehydrogenase/reductase family oxidoreductase n=1 Tax=Legionella busanensis TaxID=190655 RepID=A0A378JMB1_9GAMM|nr:SDR family oxidoreductase [Legionella busanensis]STX51828.1 short chain dehydrogenase/reductase family oxidoreductase [Legionella busanensis]
MEKKPLVVITGASKGIGRALAIKFAKEDYPCLLISRHITPIDELLGNKHVHYDNVDITDYAVFAKAIREVEKTYGKTECLINNAGHLKVGDFSNLPIETCHYELDVLVKGVINGIKIVLPDMASRKTGSIINISSAGDRKPYPTAVVYHASKHAVRCISESLQMAEAKNNVRVMNIAPGLIKTNIHENMGISFEEYCSILGNPTFIDPMELAEIIYFCFKLPQKICIRDILIMPTDCNF